MSAPPYMRLYWGNYHRQTPHLTRSQHGAYLMLLSALWNNGGKLPADDGTLAKHALCTSSEWASMKAILLPFFDIRRGKLSNSKITEELANYESTIGKRKSAGKRGAKVTNEKRYGSGSASDEHLTTKPEPEPKGRLEGSKKPSNTTRRDAPEARHEGASAFRVVQGGLSEREAWQAALERAEQDLPHFAQTDPDFASEIAEFIAVAEVEIIIASEAAA